MGNDNKIQHFNDSVHGTISVPTKYCEKIIDTSYFQRLRRIEQNSCRSVFPSARHDRFIHSLGVYHLGTLIIDSIKDKFNKKKVNPDNADVIYNTYLIACLLHDVGHTPFSHTFEDFFNIEKIEGEIKELLNDESFNNDIEKVKKAAPHEAISAYISIKVFGTVLKEWGLDLKLLVRMITGYKYLENGEPKPSFENAMIELIHGDIIDADGLDYVCRDVWAGGYKNFSIDLYRLINSIEIVCENSKYRVAYNSKALNEIEAVLNIKNFQYLYVIKHHKVLLEQYLLVESMKLTACYHLDVPSDSKDARDNALRTLCDYNIYINPKILPKSNYRLFCPMDDDFIALMKLEVSDNPYVKQWFSRNFETSPLWKSKMEYFNVFKSVFTSLSENSIKNMHKLLLSPECKHFLCAKLKLEEKDVIVIEVKPKFRRLNENKIDIILNNKIEKYSELNHDMFSVIGEKLPFCYMYINFKDINDIDKKTHIDYIISLLKDFLINGLRDQWK